MHSKKEDVKVMIDSGAHSLFEKHIGIDRERDFSFYESDEFWKFVDDYVAFVKENENNIDTYVNVDVIFNPELSWKVQKYMEKKGLHPLPVFHAGEDFKWLKKYVDNYDYIGIGGLGQTISRSKWRMSMGDPAFSIICDEKGMPRVKVHGFAMTSPDLIVTYPFYSVDSTSWFQFGKFGLLIVPKKIDGKYVYSESPHIISVSTRKKRKMEAENFDYLPELEKKAVLEYVEIKGFKMGRSDLETVEYDRSRSELPISKTERSNKEILIEEGVCNNVYIRDTLNLEYFLDLETHIPPWPRKWKRKRIMTSLPLERR